MTEFWLIVAVMMAIAFVILWPFTTWFGELLTQPPPNVQQWIQKFVSVGLLKPQIAIASTFVVIPASSAITSAPYYSGELFSGSHVRSYYSTRVIDNSAPTFITPAAA